MFASCRRSLPAPGSASQRSSHLHRPRAVCICRAIMRNAACVTCEEANSSMVLHDGKTKHVCRRPCGVVVSHENAKRALSSLLQRSFRRAFAIWGFTGWNGMSTVRSTSSDAVNMHACGFVRSLVQARCTVRGQHTSMVTAMGHSSGTVDTSIWRYLVLAVHALTVVHSCQARCECSRCWGAELRTRSHVQRTGAVYMAGDVVHARRATTPRHALMHVVPEGKQEGGGQAALYHYVRGLRLLAQQSVALDAAIPPEVLLGLLHLAEFTAPLESVYVGAMVCRHLLGRCQLATIAELFFAPTGWFAGLMPICPPIGQ
jgi:hypothetical protein